MGKKKELVLEKDVFLPSEELSLDEELPDTLYFLANDTGIIHESMEVRDEMYEASTIVYVALFKTAKDAKLYKKKNELSDYLIIPIKHIDLFNAIIVCEYVKKKLKK